MPKLTAIVPASISHASGSPAKGTAASTKATISSSLHLANQVVINCEGGQTFQNGQVIIAYTGSPSLSLNGSSTQRLDHESVNELFDQYQRNPSTLLERIKGHFALIIINLENHHCLAATDRIGVNRLYWHKTAHGDLVLSTSQRDIKTRSHLDNAISHQALYCYMYFHMVPTPFSIHPDISKLPPAHLLSFTPTALSVTPYWQPQFKTNTSSDIDELADQLLRHIEDSTRRSLVPEGKNGAFLSGGLDSSTVAGMFAKISPGEAATYSIGFNASAYDETPFASLTANHFQTRHNEYFVTPDDVLNSLPGIVQSMEEPFGNSSILPTYYCAKMAAENGVVNLLAGDGGDELFAGNKRYAIQKRYDYYLALPESIRKTLLSSLISVLPGSLPYADKAKRYIAQADIGLPKRLQIYNFLNRHPASHIFTADFLATVDPGIPDQLQQTIYDRPSKGSELDRMLYWDWHFTLADNDLRKVSQMCELVGVDVRYPLLSDELIDFSCQIADKLKLKGQQLRYFYKYAMRDFLPQQTLTKTKHGFGLPFGVWLRDYPPLRELAHDTLNQLQSRHYFKKEFIDNAFKMHEQQHASYYGELIWLMLILELWLDS